MSYEIKLLPIVHTDLRKSKEWYQKKSKILAQEFKIEVDKEIDYIGQFLNIISENIKSYDSL